MENKPFKRDMPEQQRKSLAGIKKMAPLEHGDTLDRIDKLSKKLLGAEARIIEQASTLRELRTRNYELNNTMRDERDLFAGRADTAKSEVDRLREALRVKEALADKRSDIIASINTRNSILHKKIEEQAKTRTMDETAATNNGLPPKTKHLNEIRIGAGDDRLGVAWSSFGDNLTDIDYALRTLQAMKDALTGGPQPFTKNTPIGTWESK